MTEQYFSRRIREFNEIHRYSLLSAFLLNMLCASSLLVTLQFQSVKYPLYTSSPIMPSNQNHIFLVCSQWDENSNLINTIVEYFAISMVLSFVYLLCEPGEMMIGRFAKFEDQLGQFDWYLLPIEVQSLFMVFVSNAQNPIKICSYGGIMCERETAKKVIWSWLSWLRLR